MLTHFFSYFQISKSPFSRNVLTSATFSNKVRPRESMWFPRAVWGVRNSFDNSKEGETKEPAVLVSRIENALAIQGNQPGVLSQGHLQSLSSLCWAWTPIDQPQQLAAHNPVSKKYSFFVLMFNCNPQMGKIPIFSAYSSPGLSLEHGRAVSWFWERL